MKVNANLRKPISILITHNLNYHIDPFRCIAKKKHIIKSEIMADVLLSAAVERLFGLIEEQAVYRVNLVRGAKKEVRSIGKELKKIRNVLDDAENRRLGDKKIDSWIWNLRQISYEMDDILDDWEYAILKLQKEGHPPPSKQKVCSFIPSSSCFCFKKVAVRHGIAKRIVDVKAKLDEILEEQQKYDFKNSEPTAGAGPLPRSQRVQTISSIDLGEVKGRVDEGEILVSKLVGNDGSQQELGVQVVSIVGVGGLGKTTLAQLVYNHTRVKASFDLRIWVCVSNPFDLTAIAKGILESISEGSSRADQLDVLFTRVRKNISRKKFFLVLDDVWTEDFENWESLKNGLGCGGAGSKILVTTRNDKVAETMGKSEIFRPELLSTEDCWLVLRGMSLSESKWVEFEDIGMKIAQKCCGLPLAAKTLGGLLRFKRNLREWEKVLNSEMWKMQNVEDEVFRSLLMSYNELSPREKQCFSYCAVIPKDSYIHVKTLIRLWMALGYLGSKGDDMEQDGKKCFDILSMRSLFQDFEKNELDEIKSCKMHDIVHDFAQYLRERGRVEAEELNKSTPCQVCEPSHVSNVNEFCTLILKGKYPPNLCNCFVRVRILSLSNDDLQSVPRGIDNMIRLRWLNLVGNILSTEDLKIIFQLYFLQTLNLRDCNLEEIPKEIENLSDLRQLDLSDNVLKELPSEIENLEQLRHLDLSRNYYLKEVPSEIGKLIRLQTFKLSDCENLCRVPDTLAQLTNLRKLTGFQEGSGRSKLGLLKNLNQLGGRLNLSIKLDGEDLKGTVEDAREAELRNKVHIHRLDLVFKDEMGDEEASRMDVINALAPNQNLRQLTIRNYWGSKYPVWIDSPLNLLRKVNLFYCHLASLPSLGRLSCLEEIRIVGDSELEFVGRELLGITRNTNFVAFPKLKKLNFEGCPKWKEWEDITAEEEESSSFRVMPCLKVLQIRDCSSMTLLPHRLLRKASSLEILNLSSSEKLKQRYGKKDGSDWKSISLNNPGLHLA